MQIQKFVAGTAFVVALAVSGSSVTALAQANSNAAGSTANGKPASAASVKPVKKRFLLAKPTAIYSEPDTSSAVVEHVRSGIHVNVTGITGDWLQLKLRNGKTGYIPAAAAE